MGRYQVIVGNVGTVYDGEDSVRADAEYEECRQYSIDNYGRFAGEPVTLMEDDVPLAEYAGTNTED